MWLQLMNAQCPNGLYITEFVYDVCNESTLNESTGGGEYFVLSNNTSSGIDISGGEFDNDGDVTDGDGLIIPATTSLTISANGCIIIGTTSQTNWEAEYGPVSSTGCLYYNSSSATWQGLTNTGGSIGFSGACNNGSYTDINSDGEVAIWNGTDFVNGGVVSINTDHGGQTYVPGTTNPPIAISCPSPLPTAVATCRIPDGTESEIDEYYIHITNIDEAEYELENSDDIVYTDATTGDLYLGPFDFSVDGSPNEDILLAYLGVGPCDDLRLIVSQVVCGYEVDADGTSDGMSDSALHASGPACDCEITGDDTPGLIVAQVQPGTFDPATTTMVYVLTEVVTEASCWDTNANGTNESTEDLNGDGVYNTDDCELILDFNNTGLFTDLANGIYNVYAYNVLLSDLSTFEADFNIGDHIIEAENADGCMMACEMPATYTIDCLCVCTIDNVVASADCNVNMTGGMDGTYCIDLAFTVNTPISSEYLVFVNGASVGRYAYSPGANQTQQICDTGFLGDREMGLAVEVRDAASIVQTEGVPQVVISQAVPNPSTGDETLTIFNNSCSAVDLGGFQIWDDNGTTSNLRFTFPADASSIIADQTTITLNFSNVGTYYA